MNRSSIKMYEIIICKQFSDLCIIEDIKLISNNWKNNTITDHR